MAVVRLTGIVNDDLELRMKLQLAAGGEEESYSLINALIDTGFNGELALPSELCGRMGLELVRVSSATLADGSTRTVSIFSGRVVWGNESRLVDVAGSGFVPLIGTTMLSQHRLFAEFIPGQPCHIVEIVGPPTGDK